MMAARTTRLAPADLIQTETSAGLIRLALCKDTGILKNSYIYNGRSKVIPQGRLYFNRLLSNGRSKAAILGDIEQAACASEVIQRMHPYECQ